MTRPRSFLAAASVAALLAGCNSSNNGTAVFAPDSFSAIAANSSATINGSARVMSITATSEGASTFTLDEGTNPVLVDIAATIGVDADQNINSLRVVAADIGVDQTFDETNATVDNRNYTSGLTNPTEYNQTEGGLTAGGFDIAAVTASGVVDFNYQVFGAWNQETSTTGMDVAYFTAGFQTATAGVPTSGTLTYAGLALGQIVSFQGFLFPTIAQASAGVDFGEAKTFTFATTNTRVNFFESGFSTDTDWDVSGGGALTGSTMSGTVTSTNAPGFLSGVVDAQLYGPAADEIGGTFAVTSTRCGAFCDTYIGAFGAVVTIED
jgi:hypothetical protein